MVEGHSMVFSWCLSHILLQLRPLSPAFTQHSPILLIHPLLQQLPVQCTGATMQESGCRVVLQLEDATSTDKVCQAFWWPAAKLSPSPLVFPITRCMRQGWFMAQRQVWITSCNSSPVNTKLLNRLYFDNRCGHTCISGSRGYLFWFIEDSWLHSFRQGL